MIGRRIPVEDGLNPYEAVTSAGDYYGPVVGYTGERPAVFFKLPIGGSLHHVVSPPHVFRECEDGSLEIRASILSTRGDGTEIWHGYLDEGHSWRTV